MPKIDECAICLETRALTVVEPCGHAFCSQCLHRLLARHCHCPQCRQLFLDAAPPLVCHKDRLTLRRNCGEPFGFSLEREGDDDAIVVSVSKPGGLAYRKGVRPGWIVLGINGLPCYDVGCAMQQLQGSDTVTLSVARPDSSAPAPSVCRRFYKCLCAL